MTEISGLSVTMIPKASNRYPVTIFQTVPNQAPLTIVKTSGRSTLTLIRTNGMGDAPMDGLTYARQQGAWTPIEEYQVALRHGLSLQDGAIGFNLNALPRI